MAVVILLFSLLILGVINDQLETSTIPPNSQIVITEVEVLAKAKVLMPGKEIEVTEYELEDGTLYFSVDFGTENDVKVNLFTGEVFVEEEEPEGIWEKLTDDIDKTVWLVALIVFIFSAFLSMLLATLTLRPIRKNIIKQKHFVSDAAHELRNPLAALHATIESMIMDGKNSGTKEEIEDLLSETKQLIATSESLLSLERHAHKVKHDEPCSMTEAVDETVVRLKPFIEEKKLSVTKDLASDKALMDKEDLETVLYNIIFNAVKFSKQGGTITVEWKKSILSIKDEGIGIKSEHLPYIFDRFFKADAARTHGNNGSGLGLALVKEIIEKYGFKIEVKSIPDMGTQFQIYF